MLVLDVSLVKTADSHFANYTYSLGKTVYTNVVPDKASITLKAQFNGPQIGTGTFSTTRWKTDYRSYKNPPWIRDYRLGITKTTATLSSQQKGYSHSVMLSFTISLIAIHYRHDFPIQFAVQARRYYRHSVEQHTVLSGRLHGHV